MVKCLPQLREIFDQQAKDNMGANIISMEPKNRPLIPSINGDFMTVTWYKKNMLILRKKANLAHFQGRDLRRAAVINLKIAGCDAQETRHITGHTKQSIDKMLEKHYLPVQQEIADMAMDTLEKSHLRHGPKETNEEYRLMF